MYSLQSSFFLSFVFPSFSQVHFCSWEFGRSLYKNDFCSQPSWNSARFTFLPKEVCRTNQIWNGWNSWTKKLIKIGSRSWAATYIGTTSSLKFSVSIKKWRFKWEREKERERERECSAIAIVFQCKWTPTNCPVVFASSSRPRSRLPLTKAAGKTVDD